MDNSNCSGPWAVVDVFVQHQDYNGLCQYIAEFVAPAFPNVGRSLATLVAYYGSRRIESGYSNRDLGVLCAVPIDMLARLGTVDAARPHLDRQQPGSILYRYVDGDPAIVNLGLTVPEMLELEDNTNKGELDRKMRQIAENRKRELEQIVKRITSFVLIPFSCDVNLQEYASRILDGESEFSEVVSEIKAVVRRQDYARAEREYESQIPLITPGVPRKAVKGKDYKSLVDDGGSCWWTSQSIILRVPSGTTLPGYMSPTPGYSPDILGVYRKYTQGSRQILDFAGRGTGEFDYYAFTEDGSTRVLGVNRHALALIRRFHPKGSMRLEESGGAVFVICDDAEVALLVAHKFDIVGSDSIPVPEWVIVRDRYLRRKMEESA